MVSNAQVLERRQKVAQMLSKSVTSLKEISQATQIDYETVAKDVQWIKDQTRPWLLGLAGEGYSFDCKMAIDKLMNMELELEEMRQKARQEHPDDTMKRIFIIRELRDTTIARISLEGEGPTLLALQKIKNGIPNYEK